jgi:uncharacterized protein (TIGR02996 family)
MNQERAFLQALIADPDDVPSRLVYADWLEERGDARAEYLRLECQLRSFGDADERRAPVEARLKELRFTLPQDWLVWVRWPGYGEYAPALPSVTHRLLPLNGPEMRMPRGRPWASFSHDGRWIYTCGPGRDIWIWDGSTYELHDRIRTESDNLGGPALHPTREQIAAGGADGTVRIWDVETRAEVLRAGRHAEPVAAVCFVDEGRLLASGSDDGTVRLTDTRSGGHVGRLKRLGARILTLAAPATGRTVGAVHHRGVRVWDATLTDRLRFDGIYYHGGELQSDLAFFNNGESVWVTLWGREPYLRIWSLAGTTAEPLPAAQISTGVHQLAVSHDERLAALALHHELVLLDTHTQDVLARWAVPRGTERLQGPPGGLALSPDGRRLVSTDVAGGIWVWPVPVAEKKRVGDTPPAAA